MFSDFAGSGRPAAPEASLAGEPIPYRRPDERDVLGVLPGVAGSMAPDARDGPQFRMGTIEIAGVPPSDAANLQKRWKLNAGDVFDASYPAKFIADEVRPVLRRLNLRTVGSELSPDTPSQTALMRRASTAKRSRKRLLV